MKTSPRIGLAAVLIGVCVLASVHATAQEPQGETAAGRSATADGVVGFCVRGLGAPYAA